MATRLVSIFALIAIAAGCHGTGRSPSRPPLSLVPPAPLDDTPRPRAEAAPRSTPGQVPPSTASTGAKKGTGEEESSYQFPVPPAPKELVSAPKAELPLPPAIPVSPTPPTLPPSPVDPNTPATLPPITGAARSPETPSPIPASPKPAAPAAPVALTPVAAPPMIPTSPPIPSPAAEATLPTPSGPTLALPEPVETPTNPPKPKPAEPKSVEGKPVARKLDPSNPNAELVAALAGIHDKAERSFSKMGSYTMRIRRREVIGNTVRPDEKILAKFRKEPFSVYLKWVGEVGKNREVCFVQGKYEGAIHTLLAQGDIPLLGGKVFKAAPDNPLVKSNCRYPISEAGLGPLIARFGRLVTALEKSDIREGSARYLGKVKRPEFDSPVEEVVQVLPANYESLFPSGGQRHWYFDTNPDQGLPVLIVTFDDKGREIEYYCHDLIQPVANLDEDDFNPERLGKSGSR